MIMRPNNLFFAYNTELSFMNIGINQITFINFDENMTVINTLKFETNLNKLILAYT